MRLCPLEDSGQPTVATYPRQRALGDSANSFRNEGSTVAAGAWFDGDAKRLAGLGQPLTATDEIAQRCSFGTTAGKLMQHWEDTLVVMPVCWRDVDRQREAVLVHRDMKLDALDFLAAVEAALEAGRRRMTGATIDDDGAGYGFVATGLPPL